MERGGGGHKTHIHVLRLGCGIVDAVCECGMGVWYGGCGMPVWDVVWGGVWRFGMRGCGMGLRYGDAVWVCVMGMRYGHTGIYC